MTGKDGKQLVKRPTPRKQEKRERNVRENADANGGGGSRNKKRPRSESIDEVEEASMEEEDGPPVEVDELVAAVGKHDRFFSRMLDMIPEHLVLPAKEVTESSYASKYMKVGVHAS